MKFTVAALALSQILSQVHGDGESGFTYFETGGLGPNNWATLPIETNQCGGTLGQSTFGQSPVTIDEATGSACNTGMSQYSFTGGDCAWSDLKFTINNGGVKAEKVGECSFGTMNIPHSPNKFNALQFHVHLFSEHQILGQGTDDGYFPAELHVVHQEETEESFAVFGTMIAVGADDHPTFEYLLQGWEAAAQKVQDECVEGTQTLDDSVSVVKNFDCPAIGSTTIFNGTSPSFPSDSLNVYELPTNPDFGVFTYKGGLTTPPCTEIVHWNLLDTPMEISESQLERLQSLILCYVEQHRNEDESLASCGYGTVASTTGSTSRPPQPLLGRRVLHRCPDGPEVIIEDIGVTEDDVLSQYAALDNNDDSDCVSGGMIALYVVIGVVVAFAISFVAHVQVVKRKLASSQQNAQIPAKDVNGGNGATNENDNDEKVFHT
mmetsp:Transcript_88002/g.172155  ORF Transcript_88002/g.172155 Transcript_88002/m.172155 type:complete len:435 (+) Transcript_88002:75-1379(+)